MKVVVLYNGIRKGFTSSSGETVESFMGRAIATFQPPCPLAANMILVTKGGKMLEYPQQTLAAANVQDNDLLLLRPLVVR